MDWSRITEIDPSTIADVFRNPADHPISVAFLLAIATLVLLIILLIVLAVLVGRSRPHGDHRPQRPRPTRATEESGPSEKSGVPRRRGGSGAMLALMAIAFGLSVYVPASFSSTCSSCHTMAYETDTWEKGPHASVACVECHEPRPVLLFPANAINRLSNAGGWLASRHASATVTSVDDAGCLGCHQDDIEGLVAGPGSTDAVVMRHTDVREAGYRCSECHRDTGHSIVDAAPSGPSMRRCLTCHDNRTASSDCDTCHKKDVMLAKVAQGDTYPKAELAEKKDCEGCHSMKKCDACHGLRLPHPQAFLDGEHARYAAWEKKKMCWRCHEPGDCGACHQTGGDTFGDHDPAWRWTHGVATDPDQPEACRSCHHIKPGTPMCRLCHPK